MALEPAPDRRYGGLNMHSNVVQRLGAEIVSGRRKPGDLLALDVLSLELGVSRTALREALKVLAAKGLIHSRQRMGTRVRPRRDWNLLDPDVLSWRDATGDGRFLMDVAEMRMIVEPAAAYFAAQRASEDEIADVRSHLDAMAAAAHADDLEAFIAADAAFHSRVLHAAHNELLDRMADLITAGLTANLRNTNRPPGAMRGALPRHGAIADAIADRRDEDAQAHMRDLMRHAMHDLTRELANR